MKYALPLIFAAFLTLPLAAVEYVTLSNSQKTLSVAPSSLVEIVGFTSDVAPGGMYVTYYSSAELTLANGDMLNFTFIPETTYLIGQKFTNVSQIKISLGNLENIKNSSLTLKITPAAEIGTAGPQTVLVIPENSTGDFDVVIESSGDLVTWTPMHSQTVAGNGPKTFFRTRIVKR